MKSGVYVDDLDGETCHSGSILPCARLTFGNSVFGGDDNWNNF